MTKKFWDKQIPSLLGIVLVIFGLSITIFLTNRQTFLQTNANEDPTPQEVRITNVSDNSFTISYRTTVAASGLINYGINDSLGQTAFDERDISQKIQPHFVHSISLKNLIPSTKYYFSIISGGNTYLDNNRVFEVTTAQTIPYSPTINQISGKIILSNAAPPKEAVIYVSSENSQTLSVLAASNGAYEINLNHLLTSDLSKLFDLSGKPTMQTHATGDSSSSDVTFLYLHQEKLPVITLSNNYDFRFNDENNSTPSATANSFPNINNKSTLKTKTLTTITPVQKQTSLNQKKIINQQTSSKSAVLSMSTSFTNPNETSIQSLPTIKITSIITAGIASFIITVVGGLVFLLSRKGI